MTLNELSIIIDSLKRQEKDHTKEIVLHTADKFIELVYEEDFDYVLQKNRIILYI